MLFFLTLQTKPVSTRLTLAVTTLASALWLSMPLQAASPAPDVYQLPVAPGQVLTLSLTGATAEAAQLAMLRQQLASGWQQLADQTYWPLAQQFADNGHWPGAATLLAQAWHQCEQWWQQTRLYHCRFGAARQQWQVLLPAQTVTGGNTALSNSRNTLPERVSSRRLARQLLRPDARGIVPDLQQFAYAVLLDQLWQHSRQLWPDARQIRLQYHDWQAVSGQAQPLTIAGHQHTPLGRIRLHNAVLLGSDQAATVSTIAGRYRPVWLPTEAWPVSYGPSVTVIAASFSQAWLQAQSLVAMSAQQRQQVRSSGNLPLPAEQQLPVSALWQQHPPAGAPAVSANWYRQLQDPQLQHAQSLQLTLELPAHGNHSKQPYVSAWLVHPNGQHSQLLLLGEQPRWYPELRSWWRVLKSQLPATASQHQQQLEQLADQWAGATRKAGRHQFNWPGRLANGNPLPAGQYQLVVEAAREGAGREQLKLPLRWPLAPGVHVRATGKQELGLVELQSPAP